MFQAFPIRQSLSNFSAVVQLLCGLDINVKNRFLRYQNFGKVTLVLLRK